MEIFILIPLFLVIGVVIRLFAGSFDGERVQDYIRNRGGRLLSSNWAPFGKGWFGEKNDRIYEIQYMDKDGNTHEATCKTSMLSGVYLTEDRIVSYAHRPASQHVPLSRLGELERENKRLREELQRQRGEDPEKLS